jgi:uncharacterized protein
MITATPFLAAAAEAKLEDWGPLEEATGEPMHTSGSTLWSGEIGPGDTAVFPRGWAGTWQIHETTRKLYVLF